MLPTTHSGQHMMLMLQMIVLLKGDTHFLLFTALDLLLKCFLFLDHVFCVCLGFSFLMFVRKHH